MDLEEGNNKRPLEEEEEGESSLITPNRYKKPNSGLEGAQDKGMSDSEVIDFMSDTEEEDNGSVDPPDREKGHV